MCVYTLRTTLKHTLDYSHMVYHVVWSVFGQRVTSMTPVTSLITLHYYVSRRSALVVLLCDGSPIAIGHGYC